MFHILVAEDDKNTAKLMNAVLTQEGYEVYSAENGQDALDIMGKQHIDLIVLDIMMPVMNGYELTQTLRDCGDTTPVLMVTAKQLPEERCKGFIVGTDDYMVKPVNEEEMLKQIWINLLDNAIRFSPEYSTIKVTIMQDDTNTIISIEDEGEGISDEQKAHIFDKFYQGDTSHSKNGNGLGLTIAKRVAELHGGEITVRDNNVSGTVFEVKL